MAATHGRATTGGDGLLRFRRGALRVIAATLAGGMALFVLVLPLAVPTVTGLDLAILAVAAVTHGAVAGTVGRWWEPGSAVNVAYVLFALLLVLGGISQALTPASDAPWFLLVPFTLASITLSERWQAAVALLGLGGFIGASAVGPGIDVGYVVQRSTALLIFAVGMGALNRRLHVALAAADAAQERLRADVADVANVNAELQRVDSARDDYVSSVSHELRTPLTVILGMARTLDQRWESLDDDARRHLAARVAASASGLEGIVSALLDLARIERGGLDPVVEPVALDVALPASVARLAPLLEQHQVTTQVARGTTAATDPRLLERVLDNLVTNAARHTSAGTTVTVVAAEVGDAVRIEVRDDGPGIPPQDVAQLGQQFFRGGAEGDPAREGLGLGLSLVVELLDALDSQLEVTSEVGVGTVFAFSLPRSRRDAPPA